jgi:hypothetical protein
MEQLQEKGGFLMDEHLHKWTFMVYMAGDNGKQFEGGQLMGPMEKAGNRDIAEMRKVGSTDEVAILAQFDTLSDGEASYRLHVGGEDQEQEWLQIPEQNTGDPASLVNFVLWGMEHYRAENYAVILWNHGSGWKEDDIYKFARTRSMKVAAKDDEVRSVTGQRRSLSTGLFLRSSATILGMENNEQRGIAYDDSSMDFLDNVELQKAFTQIAQESGQSIKLIGMDACLMSMIEIAYQLRLNAEYLIASQALEPMDGWPYTPILQQLTAQPDMQPVDLAKLVVSEYGRSYEEVYANSSQQITQSAVDLSRVEETAAGISRLAEFLAPSATRQDVFGETALSRAREDVVRLFEDSWHRMKDYADLYDFLVRLRDEYSGPDPKWCATMKEFLDLWEAADTNPVVAKAIVGPDQLERLGGLSIYLPPSQVYSEFYDRLDFAEKGWGPFLRKMNRVPPKRSPERINR